MYKLLLQKHYWMRISDGTQCFMSYSALIKISPSDSGPIIETEISFLPPTDIWNAPCHVTFWLN